MRNTTRGQAHRHFGNHFTGGCVNKETHNIIIIRARTIDEPMTQSIQSLQLRHLDRWVYRDIVGRNNWSHWEQRFIATKPTDEINKTKLNKAKKNMDYYVRTQYIHDMT